MSAHEKPRGAGRTHGADPGPRDRQTSDRLLDGHGPATPLADLLAAAGAPARPRELRGEHAALREFAARSVLDPRASAAGPARSALPDRLRSRRGALAAALRPVPLAKGLLATTAAVVAAFAVGSALTGPADPVDATSPAALALAETSTATTTTTTADPTTTRSAAPGPASPGRPTARPARPDVRPPAACVAWWRWAQRHRQSWPTGSPDDRSNVTAPPSPSAAADGGADGGTGGRPDRETRKACYRWWKSHRDTGFQFGDGASATRPGAGDGDRASRSGRISRAERAERAERADRIGRADRLHRSHRTPDRTDRGGQWRGDGQRSTSGFAGRSGFGRPGFGDRGRGPGHDHRDRSGDGSLERSDAWTGREDEGGSEAGPSS